MFLILKKKKSLWLGNSGPGFSLSLSLSLPPLRLSSPYPHLPRMGSQGNHFNWLFFFTIDDATKETFFSPETDIHKNHFQRDISKRVCMCGIQERICCLFKLSLLFTNLLFNDCDGRSTKQLSPHNQFWLGDNK